MLRVIRNWGPHSATSILDDSFGNSLFTPTLIVLKSCFKMFILPVWQVIAPPSTVSLHSVVPVRDSQSACDRQTTEIINSFFQYSDFLHTSRRANIAKCAIFSAAASGRSKTWRSCLASQWTTNGKFFARCEASHCRTVRCDSTNYWKDVSHFYLGNFNSSIPYWQTCWASQNCPEMQEEQAIDAWQVLAPPAMASLQTRVPDKEAQSVLDMQ